MYTSIIFFCFFFLKILVASYRCRGFPLGPGVQVCKCCFRDKCDKFHHVRTEPRYDMDVVPRLAVFARWRRGRREREEREEGEEGEEGGATFGDESHWLSRKAAPVLFPFMGVGILQVRPAPCTLPVHFPLLYKKKKKVFCVGRRGRRGADGALEVVTACGAVKYCGGRREEASDWLRAGARHHQSKCIIAGCCVEKLRGGFINSAKKQKNKKKTS